MTKAINVNEHIVDTQMFMLINHFMTIGGPLTVKKAIDLYGIYALSQRVGDARRLQFPIQDQWITVIGRHGKKRVKEYFM